MHGVLKLVVTQPIEAVLLKDAYPAHGHDHSLVYLKVLLAHGVCTPLGHTTTAGVLAGVHIQGDAIDVVGDFGPLEGVPVSLAREPFGFVRIVLLAFVGIFLGLHAFLALGLKFTS